MLKILHVILLSLFVLQPSLVIAEGDGAAKISQRTKRKSKKSKSRSRTKRRQATRKKHSLEAPREYANSIFSVQAELGYEAPYGNGVSLHFTPWRFLDFNGGVGYNSSGVRAGLGANVLLHVSPSFGFNAGASIGYSAGGSGNVSVSANFTPEGSTESESVKISKPYEISPTTLSSVSVGAFLNFSKSFGLYLSSCYTKSLSGNEVTLGDEIYYEDNLEVTNEDQIVSELNDRATEEAKIGGIGGYLGARIYL